MLILASTSRYRAELLKKTGLPFKQADPSIQETMKERETACERAARLALQKAQAVSLVNPAAWVIGSDQVATLPDGSILHKPGGRSEAVRQLVESSGKTITFHTAVSLVNEDAHFAETETDTFHVQFRHLTQTEVEGYVDRDQPFDCAGSFRSEGLGICLFERLEGKDPNSLIGLPLISLTTLLQKAGINPLTFHQKNP